MPDTATTAAPAWPGVYPALVTDLRDPQALGRVQVSLPWAADPEGARPMAWARLATLAAGAGSGTWFLPAVGDEVLVAFQAGDPSLPVVLGGLWNGQQRPPQAVAADGSNHHRVIRTPRGVVVDLFDGPGRASLTLRTPGGCELVLDDGSQEVRVSDGQGNHVEIKNGEVRVTATKAVVVSASKVSISAGSVQMDTGMLKVSGVVRADTLIANSVVASSYTPGAGNIV